MKLRIKETGEIVELVGEVKRSDGKPDFTLDSYDTLSQLCEAVEDYEEPKQWYGLNAIRDDGFEPLEYEGFEDLYKHAKELGIGFETKEEAEKAVEKLKAWKMLKDRGFKWLFYEMGDGDKFRVHFSIKDGVNVGTYLDILFGGEE